MLGPQVYGSIYKPEINVLIPGPSIRSELSQFLFTELLAKDLNCSPETRSLHSGSPDALQMPSSTPDLQIM